MLKFLIKTLAAMVGIVMFVAVVFFISINPNDYKDLIASKIEGMTDISIQIKGDIAWSFVPLGFKIKGLTINDKNSQLFAGLDSVDLAIDTFSLLTLKPLVDGLYVNGGTLNLEVNQAGQANWSNLIAFEKIEDAWTYKPVNLTQGDSSPAQPLTNDGTGPASSASLAFVLRHLELSDFDIEYKDFTKDQFISVSELEITMRDTQIGQEFPLSASYLLRSPKQQIQYRHNIDTHILVNKDLDKVSASNMESALDIIGKITRDASLKLSLTGDLALDLQDQSISGENIQLSGAGLALDASFGIESDNNAFRATGLVNLAPLDIKSFVSRLAFDLSGLPEGLKTVDFKTPFEYTPAKLLLPSFEAGIDTTTALGRLGYRFHDGDIDVTLKVDSLDLDRYLAADSAKTFTLPNIAAVSSNPDNSSITQALLPLDLLSDLNLILSLKQDRLRFKGIDFMDLDLEAEVHNGVIKIPEANTSVLGGRLEGSLNIDTGLPEPIWEGNTNIAGIDALQLFNGVQLGDQTYHGEGKLYAEGTFEAFGNTVDKLKRSNKGSVRFRLEDGVLVGVNLNKQMCQGFASVRGAKPTRTEWSENTGVKTLMGSVSLKNGVIFSRDLILETIELNAAGNAEFDILNENFRYDLEVRPVKNAADPACEINPKFDDLFIPISCSGQLQPFKNSCGLNSNKVLQQVAQLGNKEATRKTQKEINRAVDKAVEKYLKDDSEVGQALKKSLSELFN